jgi:branched-chain amino acid aminotransferase
MAMRGANVYEGLRGRWDDRTGVLNIWKLDAPLDRLFQSMTIMRMASPCTKHQLRQAVIDGARANAFREDVHFRPVVHLGDGGSGGLRACEAGVSHQNNRLATMQSRTDGYDDALILTREGKLAEAKGAAVLIVRDGELITPPVTSGLLESLARNFILPLQDRCGKRAPVQREVERTALCIADEIFVCGTAEELTPVVSADRIAIGDGKPGPMIRRFQRWLRDAARGRDPDWRDQIVPVR